MLHHMPPLVLLPHFLASVPPWVENIWNIWLKFDFWALPFHNWILWLELYSYIDYIWVYTKLWFFQRSPNRSWRNEKHRHSANDRLNWTRWHPCFLGKETLKIFLAKLFSQLTLSLLLNNITFFTPSELFSIQAFSRNCRAASVEDRRRPVLRAAVWPKQTRTRFPARSSLTEQTLARTTKLSCPRGRGAGGLGQPKFGDDGWF